MYNRKGEVCIVDESTRHLVTKQSSKIEVFVYNNKQKCNASYLYSAMCLIYEASQKNMSTIVYNRKGEVYIIDESTRHLVTKQSSKIEVFVYNNKQKCNASYLYSAMCLIYEASQKNMSTIVYNEKGEIDSKTIIEKINKKYLRGVIILGINNSIDDNNDIKKLENYENFRLQSTRKYKCHKSVDIINSISKPLNYLKGLNHKKK